MFTLPSATGRISRLISSMSPAEAAVDTATAFEQEPVSAEVGTDAFKRQSKIDLMPTGKEIGDTVAAQFR